MIALRKGSVVGGRYRIEFMIGRGGMGTVYGVRHLNTDEKLALKLLHPALAENQDAVERFRTEARAPVRIESEHVVRVVDADIATELDNVPYMVMERLKGHDLRSELKRRGALPAGEVVLYLKQVARALDKAHQHGIVHRDLKPANMYIVKREDGSPLVKVLDFGIAKLTDDAAKELTVAGQVFGTPWYMAPEQARGDLGRVGPGTDLWAIGLIAYQLLTGRNYWTADGMAALVGQICYEPMPAPTQSAPHLGPLFDMWFSRACNRDPRQRFGSAKEMVQELAQALGVNQSSGITTASGQHRNMDSSLQISVPGTAVPMGPGPTGGYSRSPPTMNVLEATAAPLYSTTSPKSKSGPMAAIALGIGIALLIGGVGVWMVMPDAPPVTGVEPAASIPPTPSPPEPVEEDPAPTPDPVDDPLPVESAAPKASASASVSAKASVPPPPHGNVRHPPRERPKKPPKVAPKVGDVEF